MDLQQRKVSNNDVSIKYSASDNTHKRKRESSSKEPSSKKAYYEEPAVDRVIE